MSNKFDDVLAELAGQAGGLDPLLDCFFGFLYRKTDFYVHFENKNAAYKMGFPKGEAERMLLKAFRKYEFRNAEPVETRSSSSAPIQPAAKKPVATAKAIETPSTTKQSVFKVPASDPESVAVQTPIGNGGVGKNYYWTQTLNELNIYIDTKPGVKSKQVKCNIAPRSISVQVDNETLLEGSFEDAIKSTESMWTLCSGDGGPGYEGGPQIIITLDKTRHTWWKSVVVGDPEIDTSKVDSSRNITDYDESTQATIRKIMHDQKQKVL